MTIRAPQTNKLAFLLANSNLHTPVDLPSIITSPILNSKERKQRRWKEGEDVCRGRKGFFDFKNEHEFVEENTNMEL